MLVFRSPFTAAGAPRLRSTLYRELADRLFVTVAHRPRALSSETLFLSKRLAAKIGHPRQAALFACMLFVLARPALGLEESIRNDTPPVVVRAEYSGDWTPDIAANAKLAKLARRKLRSRMAKAAGPDGKPGPQSGSHGGGADTRGAAGMPRGERKQPPQFPDQPQIPTAVGLMREEMDFAAPLEGNLFILQDGEMVAMGKNLESATILSFDRGAIEIGNAGVTASAMLTIDGLHVEFRAPEDVEVIHTYSLEANGTRLRVRTNVSGRRLSIPGGLEIERVYNRVSPTFNP